MAHDKKQTLPSSKVNGNEPVESLYTTPLFLFANAPKQMTFAMDSSLSIPIRWDPVMCHTQASDTVGAAKKWQSRCKRTGMMRMGAMPIKGILGVVLRIPCRDHFICPLAALRLGLRYLSIVKRPQWEIQLIDILVNYVLLLCFYSWMVEASGMSLLYS
jgi:hypothetical protein